MLARSHRLWVPLALLFHVGPAAAQDLGGRIVFHGRVEDSTSEAPIAGARLLAADSSITVVTDSAGEFAVPLPVGGPHTVYVDQIAYLGQRFDFEAASASRFLVLRLEPQPFELEELTVVAEAALSQLVRSIETRARAYPHSMASLDKTALESFGSASVFEVVRTRASFMRPCNRNSSEICVPGRFVTFRNPSPQVRVRVCIDEQPSYFPVPELSNMSLQSVALVEIFAREAIRVYTVAWMLRQARRGHTSVYPEWMAC